jgi:hypothetical protein
MYRLEHVFIITISIKTREILVRFFSTERRFNKNAQTVNVIIFNVNINEISGRFILLIQRRTILSYLISTNDGVHLSMVRRFYHAMLINTHIVISS